MRSSLTILLFRRRNKKPQEDHPVGDCFDAVQRHGRVLERSVGVDADVAVLRSSILS
jgi:hypothetical protein